MILSGIAQAPPTERDDGKVSISLYFRWNKSASDGEFVTNSAAMDSFIKAVGRMDSDQISSIDATAYSSPEGVYEHNMKLSRERANYLDRVLHDRLPDLSDRIRVRAGGEAWALLRERIVEDPKLTNWWRERILKFLDNDTISNDTRKWRLIHWLGYDPDMGDMYNYLLREHYKYLRSGIIVVVTVNDEAAAEQVARAAETAATEKEQPAEPEIVEPATPVEPETPAGQETEPEPQPEQEREAVEIAAHEMEQRAGTTTEEHAVELGQGISKLHIREFVPTFGISTNIPYDITYIPHYGLTSIPSFSLEYYPGGVGHWTVGADVEWPMWQHWDTQRFFQINNITLWGRRYFSPSEGHRRGLYLFGNMNAARYGIAYDWKGWKGEGIGASAGIGHKWTFGRRLYLDLGAAIGVFYSGYDPFVYGNDALGWYYYDYAGKPEDFQERNKRLIWFGPTRLYISIGFDFFNRNRK